MITVKLICPECVHRFEMNIFGESKDKKKVKVPVNFVKCPKCGALVERVE